ncbi:hypothetical protein DUI87_06478 [Hirundo rustica rustica]|uniref:Uncharacterized protein n=1 Tax=Hirundo rustica rustica TaxID=333673 RepID=A0A3M0KV15_HIRRU|nr:hypothetical protein DUI87_06478 [Hirundo rustica rustica]
MAQSVVYADLKFAAGPSSTVPDDDDSPYENVPLGPVTAEPIPDWQVTRSLQDTSREHTAEQGRLSQELRAREQSLEQTQLELAWARGELQRAWHNGNITQLELDSRNAELGHTQQKLAVLQEEMQVVQGRLNTSESTVSSLRACMNTVSLQREECVGTNFAKLDLTKQPAGLHHKFCPTKPVAFYNGATE